MSEETVLVTGGSGFIAGHCILRLLDQGYTVRTTVRSLNRESAIRATLQEAGMAHGEALSFVAADLTGDGGWASAMRGVDYVLHVASPLTTGQVKNEDDVIGPARDGALRVLRAARDNGVKRIVLTSAFHAVGFGHPHTDHVFTEEDWSNIDGPGIDAYGKSKILAERAAWDFVDREAGPLELVTILPVAVLGPVLGSQVSGANHIVQQMLSGAMPGYPNMYVPIVDVRDVAFAHVAAMTAPGAADRRFLISSGEPAMAMREMGSILRERFDGAAKRVPSRRIPDVVVRLAARFKPEFRPVAADLNFVKRVSNDQARAVLGLQPRTATEAIIAAGASILAKGLVAT